MRPEINRDKWTEIEEEQLQVLVEKYNMRNWTQIAKELGVGEISGDFLLISRGPIMAYPIENSQFFSQYHVRFSNKKKSKKKIFFFLTFFFLPLLLMRNNDPYQNDT